MVPGGGKTDRGLQRPTTAESTFVKAYMAVVRLPGVLEFRDLM